MTEPYRDQHLRCPACRDVALRAFQTRLICDRCEGMMVPLDDLAAAILEMTSLEATFEYLDEAAGTRTCPRCLVTMATCKLRIVLDEELVKPRPQLDRCTAHGIWFDSEELAKVFEKVAGKGLGGGGSGLRRGRGGGVNAPSGSYG